MCLRFFCGRLSRARTIFVAFRGFSRAFFPQVSSSVLFDFNMLRWTGWHFASIPCSKLVTIVISDIPSYNTPHLPALSTKVFYTKCRRQIAYFATICFKYLYPIWLMLVVKMSESGDLLSRKPRLQFDRMHSTDY